MGAFLVSSKSEGLCIILVGAVLLQFFGSHQTFPWQVVPTLVIGVFAAGIITLYRDWHLAFLVGVADHRGIFPGFVFSLCGWFDGGGGVRAWVGWMLGSSEKFICLIISNKFT